MTLGGGVSGAIHRKAGPLLWKQCQKLGGCRTGEAKITKGYALKAAYVIHTVGPVYQGSPRDPVLLASCYRNALQLAQSSELKSISFPAISTGIFGYPLKKAAPIAIDTVQNWLAHYDGAMVVQFVLFDDKGYLFYRDHLRD